jgi:pyruvate carboxylase
VFSKVLIANRGEIAIRAFRAAYELGAATVALYPYEGRNSVHRLKADEPHLTSLAGAVFARNVCRPEQKIRRAEETT